MKPCLKSRNGLRHFQFFFSAAELKPVFERALSPTFEIVRFGKHPEYDFILSYKLATGRDIWPFGKPMVFRNYFPPEYWGIEFVLREISENKALWKKIMAMGVDENDSWRLRC